jgi:uncharacterized membrane protein YeaQ/YmgE (transglycosylase-associated protein family)
MEILLWLVVGLIAGWLASIVMRTDAAQGPLMDIVMGIIGAFVGGFLMNMFGQPGVTGFNVYSILVATIGAIVVIALSRMVMRRA